MKAMGKHANIGYIWMHGALKLDCFGYAFSNKQTDNKSTDRCVWCFLLYTSRWTINPFDYWLSRRARLSSLVNASARYRMHWIPFNIKMSEPMLQQLQPRCTAGGILRVVKYLTSRCCCLNRCCNVVVMPEIRFFYFHIHCIYSQCVYQVKEICFYQITPVCLCVSVTMCLQLTHRNSFCYCVFVHDTKYRDWHLNFASKNTHTDTRTQTRAKRTQSTVSSTIAVNATATATDNNDDDRWRYRRRRCSNPSFFANTFHIIKYYAAHSNTFC